MPIRVYDDDRSQEEAEPEEPASTMSAPAPQVADTRPAGERFLDWLFATPTCTRAVMVLSGAFYICSFVFRTIEFHLAFCVFEVLHLQVWRFFTSPFVNSAILNLVICLFIFYRMGISFEAALGTISFAYHFMLLHTLSMVIYFIGTFGMLMAKPVPMLPGVGCTSGLFTVFMALLNIQVRRSGQENMSFWGLCQVPAKWYPFVLLGVLTLLGSPLLTNLSGLIVGYLYDVGFLNKLIPSPAFFQALDASPKWQLLSQSPAFVSTVAGDLTFGSTFLPSQFGNRGNANQGGGSAGGSGGGGMMNRMFGRGGAPEGGSQPFSGTGHRLGDA